MAAKRVTPLSAVVDEKLYIMGNTRKDFAKKLGISYNYVTTILNGQYKPTIDITNRMAKILDMDSSKLRELALKKVV